jgi:hypothetical protein
MTTDDMENELRTLLRERAGEAPMSTPTGAPQQVLRRGRMHQVGTVLGSAALVVVLIVGSVAGLTRILGEGRGDVARDGGYEVFQRTATVEAFTLTSASDWYLVNQWPLSMQIAVETSGGASSPCVAEPGITTKECEEIPGEASSSPVPMPHGLPMLQLSNVDMGLGSIACRDGLADSAAVLYIAMDPGGGLAPDGASLAPYPIGPGLPAPADAGPCGPGTYAHFTVNGTPMFFWIGVGDRATDEDRAAVRRTAEMMVADDAWEPSQPDHVTPGYVIASGATAAGDDWRIEARPGTEVELSLFAPAPMGAPQTSLGDDPVYWCCTSMTAPDEAGDPVFGAVQPGAAGVEFRPEDGRDPIAGRILPPPPSLGLDFDLFFIEGTLGLRGDVVALGIDSSAQPSPSADVRDETVELAGSLEGRGWRVVFFGTFAGPGSACWELHVEGPSREVCPDPVHSTIAGPSPYLVGSSWQELHLLAGSVPPEVAQIRFVGDDDAIVPQSFRCETGPLGWTDPDVKVCAMALPPSGSGTVEYLDGSGDVLYEEGIAWGAAEPEAPTPVEPMHGGTYWAVYPWVGEPGDAHANRVIGRLFDDYGIQAHQGDLSCDVGAAEALGNASSWGVAVYFETRADAQVFATQVVRSGVTPDAAIAQVTTYCLD